MGMGIAASKGWWEKLGKARFGKSGRLIRTKGRNHGTGQLGMVFHLFQQAGNETSPTPPW